MDDAHDGYDDDDVEDAEDNNERESCVLENPEGMLVGGTEGGEVGLRDVLWMEVYIDEAAVAADVVGADRDAGERCGL